MSRTLQLIVEGSGDVQAVPVLVRRMLEMKSVFDVRIAQPAHRRGDLPKVRARFSDFFQAAMLDGDAVLCVLDFDCEDCVDVEAEEENFRRMASEIRPEFPFDVCFIVKEFESLFLCDEAAVRTVLPRIRDDYVFPVDPESIRDAKGELTAAQEKGWSYKPMVHQTRMAAVLNLDAVRARSPSFRRLEAAVDRLMPVSSADWGSW